eukprot:TRINITY_DN2018_c0_g2_i4.p1 TRINITY_DN2018_c0_g2~~TRINITY_DN2018_c0_g2_i4.p1  ORF type:complete len:438 (+),score=51.99 TRINITY_DN2018_c0_g2_i4:147-1460(+)
MTIFDFKVYILTSLLQVVSPQEDANDTSSMAGIQQYIESLQPMDQQDNQSMQLQASQPFTSDQTSIDNNSLPIQVAPEAVQNNSLTELPQTELVTSSNNKSGYEIKEAPLQEPKTQQQLLKTLARPTKVPLTFRYRETIFGQQCIFPFMYKGEEYTECFKLPNGKEYCVMLNGALYVCAELPPIDPTPMEIEERLTLSGIQCQLPILHEGTVLLGCLNTTFGTEICYNGDEWEECAQPIPSQPSLENDTSNQNISNEENCLFPFEYNDSLRFTCVEMSDGNEWCQIDGNWKRCDKDNNNNEQNLSEDEDEDDDNEDRDESIPLYDQMSRYQDNLFNGDYLSTYYGYQPDVAQISSEEKQVDGKKQEEGISPVVIALVLVLLLLLVGTIVFGIITCRIRRSMVKQKEKEKKEEKKISSELSQVNRAQLIEQLAGLGQA